jgi:hypothetical protein
MPWAAHKSWEISSNFNGESLYSLTDLLWLKHSSRETLPVRLGSGSVIVDKMATGAVFGGSPPEGLQAGKISSPTSKINHNLLLIPLLLLPPIIQNAGWVYRPLSPGATHHSFSHIYSG